MLRYEMLRLQASDIKAMLDAGTLLWSDGSVATMRPQQVDRQTADWRERQWEIMNRALSEARRESMS